MGHIIRMPLGGLVWHYLQYVMGLARLGHDVYYAEDGCLFESDEYAWFYNPVTRTTDGDSTFGLRFAEQAFERNGLGDRWALYDPRRSEWIGPPAARMPEICRSAELLINVSCANPVRPMLRGIPWRAVIDTDPTFFQVRVLTNPVRKELALQHNAFFTFGENIETGSALTPDDGLPWRATRQPIVLDSWPVTPGPSARRLTTVMAWESYRQPEEFNGVRYGPKAESFGPYLSLPERVNCDLELALFGSSAPRDQLREHGWLIVDGERATQDPWDYQSYIRGSFAEFSPAKQGYVSSHCGWFSERSAAYLASGRPVLVQDTGFSEWLPVGDGVLSFASPDEAVAAIDVVGADYRHHCVAARDLARRFFDSGKVLESLVERAVNPPREAGAPGH